MKPFISFVMPVRNCSAFLAESIRSILRQSLKNIEIIILDDCSTDSSWDIIKYFQNKDKRIRAYQITEHRGAGFCRNEGNKYAKSDVICVADAGDLYHYGRARATYKYFQKNESIDIFSSGVDVVDSSNRHLKYEFPRLLDKAYGVKPSICHPTVGYRKKVTQAIKYREVTKHTDLYEAFLLEAIRHGFKHGFVNVVYVKKRYTPELPGFRDLVEAWKWKKKVYIEFGIPLPNFLKRKLTWRRITKYRY